MRHSIGKLSIGILSWKRTELLEQTLRTYQRAGLLDLAHDVTIFFNEMSDNDLLVSERFGLRAIGRRENIGIKPALQILADQALGEYFLFLENDWSLIEPKEVLRRRLSTAMDLLSKQEVQCVRLRHRTHPGDPLHSRKAYEGREESGLEHLLDSVHWLSDPEIRFPDRISRTVIDDEPWFFSSSKNANYTNNPCLYKKDFIQNLLRQQFESSRSASAVEYARVKGVDVATISLEGDIFSWWQNQNFRIAQSEGLFEHRDSLRPSILRTSRILLNRVLRKLKSLGSPPKIPKSHRRKIAFVSAHRTTDVWSTPLSLMREFEARGWDVRVFSLFDAKDQYTDLEVKRLYELSCSGEFVPDMVFHLDFTGFQTPWFKRLRALGCFMVFEAADEPRQYGVNKPKAKDFHLILSPDYRSVQRHRSAGHHCLWWTHFADTRIHHPVEGVVERSLAVSTRGRGGSAFLDQLEDRLQGLFENRNGLFGDDYSQFLCSGAIVVQNSRDHEITRRLFETGACGKLILSDRLPRHTEVQRIFTEDREIVYYDDLDSAVEKIQHLLSPEGEALRKTIAARSRESVLSHHTQVQRVDVILQQYRKFSGDE